MNIWVQLLELFDHIEPKTTLLERLLRLLSFQAFWEWESVYLVTIALWPVASLEHYTYATFAEKFQSQSRVKIFGRNNMDQVGS